MRFILGARSKISSFSSSKGIIIPLYQLLFSVSPFGLFIVSAQQSGTMAAGTSAPNKIMLYHHPHSYYSQKVVMTLHEKNVPYKETIVDIMNYEHYSKWFLDINPRAEIPVIKDGEKVIPDSKRIIDYLDENYSDGHFKKLIPTDPVIRAKMEDLRGKIDSVEANMITFGAAVHREFVSNEGYPFSYEFIRKGLKDGEANMSVSLRKLAETRPDIRDTLLKKADDKEKAHEIIYDKAKFEAELEKVRQVFQAVEDQLKSNSAGGSTWLLTDQFTQADVSLTILMNRMSRIGLAAKLWGDKPLVAKYYLRAQLRPSYKQTVPTPFGDAVNLIADIPRKLFHWPRR